MTGQQGIKSWPEGERPRERLLRDGGHSLSDAQLLAILLRTGREDASAVSLAMELLTRCGPIQNLPQMASAELCRVHGIGPAKAAQVLAAIELGRRVAAAPLAPRMRIRGSADVVRHYRPHLRDLKHEVFVALLLNGKNQVLREAHISTGSLTLNIVHPREAFREAIKEGAAAVLFLHNHPSGDPTPSREDRELTARLREVGELVGIPVLDHIIIGDPRHVSFAESGWAP